jgi:acetyl-CoA acyltransferase
MQSQRSAVIVDAVRTPTGRRNGRLSGWHASELAAQVLAELVSRNGIDPAAVDDVIMGCVHQVGPQTLNVGRTAVLAAGWPESVSATTIDRQCGSSQQAVHFAAQGIVAGAYDVAVAAGVEIMSAVPMGSTMVAGMDGPFGEAVQRRYADRETFGEIGLIPQGLSAELLANRWNLSREDLDAFGLRSQQLAGAARDAGHFDSELVPVQERRRDPETGAVTRVDEMVTSDGGIRDSTAEALAGLKPAFLPSGRVTAGNSSQIADGAAAVLVMEESVAKRHGLTPLARVANFALAGDDPVAMLTAPIPATRKLLERAGLTVGDIDLFEVNEAFASVVLAWAQALEVDLDRVNVNGGAIALGHPLGASGARLVATLVHEMRRRGSRYGVQTMCEGGGLSNATLYENLV